jgi:hypothetical protein
MCSAVHIYVIKRGFAGLRNDSLEGHGSADEIINPFFLTFLTGEISRNRKKSS